jgi:hypothetical protein
MGRWLIYSEVVIPDPSYRKTAMPLILRCYTDAAGRDVIRDWYAAQDRDTQGDIYGVFVILENAESARYDEHLFKRLAKKAGSKCEGLIEILIDKDGQHRRIVGFWGPRANEFTMVYPFHKNYNASYRVPCEKTLQSKAEIDRDHGRSTRLNLPAPDEA